MLKHFISIQLTIFIFFNFNFLFSDHSEELHLAFQDGLVNRQYIEVAPNRHLRYAHFKSPQPSKGAVLFIQGRGTFLEFYEILITPLLERQLDVWMYDLSGQGGSTRLLANSQFDQQTIQYMQHADDFSLYLHDMDKFIKEIFLPNANQPLLYLGGYSTGAHLALRYLQTNTNHSFKSAFVISPLLNFRLPLRHTFIDYLFWSTSYFINLKNYVSGMSHEDPIFCMTFETNPYTGDQDLFHQMQTLCSENLMYMMGGISYGWLKSGIDSLNLLWKDEAIQNIQIPILLATGGEDTVVDISYNEYFSCKLPQANHVFYPKARHEIFRETQSIRTEWWKHFDEFVNHLEEEITD